MLRNDAGEVIRDAKLDGEARICDVEWPQFVVATKRTLYLVNANLKVPESGRRLTLPKLFAEKQTNWRSWVI